MNTKDMGMTHSRQQQFSLKHFYHLSVGLIILVGILLSVGAPQVKYLAPLALALYLIICTTSNLRVVVQVLPIYLGLEGFWKILMNYHPVAHIGIDIGISIVLLRTFFLKKGSLSEISASYRLSFGLLAVWILIQSLNPFGWGVIPALSGIKLYLLPSLLAMSFFLVGKREDFTRFTAAVILVAFVNGVTSYFQYLGGESFLYSISPYYHKALKGEIFTGAKFRPVGTGTVAGAASIWIFYAAPFVFYFLHEFFKKGKYIKGLVLLVTWTPTAVMTLFSCQVRSAMIKTVLGTAFAGFFMIYYGIRLGSDLQRAKRLGGVFFLAGLLFLLFIPSWNLVSQFKTSEVLVDRASTLLDSDAVSTSRASPLVVLEDILYTIEHYPLGVGPGRHGGAAGRFAKEKAESYQIEGRVEWTHDNLFMTVIKELGIPGSLLYLAMAFPFLLSFFRVNEENFHWVIGAFIILIGNWGAIGLTANPEGPLFWCTLLFAAKGYSDQKIEKTIQKEKTTSQLNISPSYS